MGNKWLAYKDLNTGYIKAVVILINNMSTVCKKVEN